MTGFKLTVVAGILGIVLAGCANGQVVVKTMCPKLPNPPVGAVSALENAGKKDPDVAGYTVALDKHYDKLDKCN